MNIEQIKGDLIVQFKYGKVKFGYKDTWSMDLVLKQIIADGVRKFKEVIIEKKDTDYVSVPISVFTKEELSNFVDVTDEHFQRWVDILDKIIYAFEDNEPSTDDYNYTHEFIRGEPDEHGNTSMTILRSDENEHQRWLNDSKIHKDKVLDGRKLFAEHFDGLWW